MGRPLGSAHNCAIRGRPPIQPGGQLALRSPAWESKLSRCSGTALRQQFSLKRAARRDKKRARQLVFCCPFPWAFPPPPAGPPLLRHTLGRAESPPRRREESASEGKEGKEGSASKHGRIVAPIPLPHSFAAPLRRSASPRPPRAAQLDNFAYLCFPFAMRVSLHASLRLACLCPKKVHAPIRARRWGGRGRGNCRERGRPGNVKQGRQTLAVRSAPRMEGRRVVGGSLTQDSGTRRSRHRCLSRHAPPYEPALAS